MATVCPQCGKPLDGDQCEVCVARVADLQKTFFLFQMWVAVAGFFGMYLALGLYPPLGWDSILADHVLDFFVYPGAIVFLLVLCNRLARYAAFVKLMLGLASSALAILAAFIFLNGAWDTNPPVEAQALVLNKSVSHMKGPNFDLDLIVQWNRKEIKEGITVKRGTFSVMEPGASVSLKVHPGAFSTPWYGNGNIQLGDDAIRLNSR